MFVRLVDPMNVQETGADQGASARFGGRRAFPQQFYFKSAFLAGLAQSRLFRIFIQLDVPAQGQPFVQLPMVDEQHPAFMDHENRHGEINLLMNVRHGLERGQT